MKYFVEIPLSDKTLEVIDNTLLSDYLWTRALFALLREYGGEQLRGITFIHYSQQNSEQVWRTEFEVDIHPSPNEEQT